MERFFQLEQRGTTVRREMAAGLTTFATMAYIIFVNPAILSQAGMDFNAVMIATCLAAATGCLLSGLLANYPFAQAPGMGLNAFFVYTIVFQSGYSWQAALAIVFISGVVFIVLTTTGLRAAIVNALPASVRHAIPAGIGLFIALIGMNNAGLIDVNQGPIIDILLSGETATTEETIAAVQDAPPQVLQFGNLGDPTVLLTLFGLAAMALMLVRGVGAAILLGIVLTTLLSLAVGQASLPDSIATADFDLSPTLLQLDFGTLFGDGGFTALIFFDLIFVIIAFTLVDLLDTMGTLYGTADKGGFLDKDGKLPRINRALMADAVATTVGALFGTSTTTTYIESGTGIAAGGRTGLTALVVAALFLLAIVLTPLAGMIPVAATAPALIMVGILMLGAVNKIDFSKLEEAIPAFLVITLMPFTYSIANGIGAGIIAFVLIRTVQGQARSIHPAAVVIAALFVMRYVFV